MSAKLQAAQFARKAFADYRRELRMAGHSIDRVLFYHGKVVIDREWYEIVMRPQLIGEMDLRLPALLPSLPQFPRQLDHFPRHNMAHALSPPLKKRSGTAPPPGYGARKSAHPRATARLTSNPRGAGAQPSSSAQRSIDAWNEFAERKAKGART